MTSQDLMSVKLGGAGNFRFSAVRPENLEATEYTLATLVVDTSGSVTGYADDLMKAVKAAIDSLRKSPRADNLLVRLVEFNTTLNELHGFLPLNSIDTNTYQPFNPRGVTALFDASYEAIKSTAAYAKTLVDNDFDVNAAVFIITDGYDNQSSLSPKQVADAVLAIRKDEQLESIITVLIGVGDNPQNNTYLANFKDQAQLTQFVEMGEATPQRLAKMGGFVSKSIVSQSQSLGTGGPSASQSLII